MLSVQEDKVTEYKWFHQGCFPTKERKKDGRADHPFIFIAFWEYSYSAKVISIFPT